MSKDNTEFPSFLESSEVANPLGKALQDARTNANLSVKEVANKLNLSITTILDLENNLDNVLETQKYPVIYLRGYLLNYAKLVGLTGLGLYAEFQVLNSAQKQKQTLKSPSLIIPRTKKRAKKWPVLFLLLITIAACAYYFQVPLFNAIGLQVQTSEPVSGLSSESEFQQDLAKKLLLQSSQSENTDNAPSSGGDENTISEDIIEELPEELENEVNNIILDNAVVQENSENIVLDPVNSPISSNLEEIEVRNEIITDISVNNDVITSDESGNDLIANEIVAIAEIESEADNAIDGAPEDLSLVFNGECWTEVFDATGERIAFGLYNKGQVLMLSGMAPFKLKLGNPRAVEIEYQDKIIEGEFTPGRSAQFSVPLS